MADPNVKLVGIDLAGTPVEQAWGWRDWALRSDRPVPVQQAGAMLDDQLFSLMASQCRHWAGQWDAYSQSMFGSLCGDWWERVSAALDRLAEAVAAWSRSSAEAVASTAQGVRHTGETAQTVVPTITQATPWWVWAALALAIARGMR